MELSFETIAVVGEGNFPDFVQFEKTEGELFILDNGLMYGIPSGRLNGDFSNPTWLAPVAVGPEGDQNMSHLEIKTIAGFGIVGSYKTDTAQKLLIYEYMIEMDRYLESGSIKHSMDTPIAAFTLNLENPIDENPEHHGNAAISEETSLLSPGSKVSFDFSMGDSEPYHMGSFYVDRSSFTLLDETITVDGRNIIGKALNDQTFDEESTYAYNIIHETLKNILLKANITSDEMLVENTSVYAGYQFDVTMSYLEGTMEILKALDNWKVEELVDGTVVIGSSNYSGFVRNSSYVFHRDKDIFTRGIIRDDQEAYRKVCVHTGDFNIKVYREVETYSGWNLQANKTLYVNVPDGTSLTDVQSYAEQIANNLQYVGKIESFTGPFRPQIIIGDEAVIIGQNGSVSLGQITEITHRFGKNGFYTDFTVDSGGRLGKGRLSDYIARITRDKTSSNRLYE